MCGYLREANVPWLEFPMDPSLICPVGSFRMRSPLLTLTPIPGEIHFPLLPLNFPANLKSLEHVEVLSWRGSRGTVAAVSGSQRCLNHAETLRRAPCAGDGA